MRKSWLVLAILTLLLRSNGALALVDIQGKEKVEVGSWSELKAAVADSANAGKVIVLKGDITADKANPITSVGGAGIIIDGNGHTITGQETASDGQFINFYNKNTDLIIQNVNFEGFVTNLSNSYGGIIANTGLYGEDKIIGDISGNFKNNSIKSTSNSSSGGVIGNTGTIGNITGDFENNSAQSETSSAEGGAISNSGTLGDITGDFRNNSVQAGDYAQGGAILNEGATIGDIEGDFIGNSVISGDVYYYFWAQGGGAIFNNSSKIGNIVGSFENNFVKAETTFAAGGAIFNYNIAKIGNIVGDFLGNYVQSGNYYAQGGAIFNGNSSSIIGDVTGDFSGNYAQAETYAQGGAVYNSGVVTFVNSSFMDNYVETKATKDSEDGRKAQGGAIYTESDLTIKADNGQSVFRGNKVKWEDGEESSAIYLGGDDGKYSNLFLDSQNNGLIQFDDKIASVSQVEDYLQSAINAGATVTDDGKGGYIIDYKGQQIAVENDNGVFWGLMEQASMGKDEAETFLPQLEQIGLEVIKDGDNYYIDDPSGLLEGVPAKYEFIVQADGNYLIYMYQGLSFYGGNITISGDEGSQVVFNNAIENVAKINISGTKV